MGVFKEARKWHGEAVTACRSMEGTVKFTREQLSGGQQIDSLNRTLEVMRMPWRLEDMAFKLKASHHLKMEFFKLEAGSQEQSSIG